ncbi:glycosyltransferase family 2 protein [Polaromonas sp. CG_9.11]|uniref:glycosyltransferase family 2 protein n=1 Tax=Polaromonas sp. CG_9.11 TaxID=2787730 RepID=UPI0018CBB664|nr:glycosyltransferase family 2 protein [Polaromonas sp. CG_9.11]MBG6075628.1 glycosyltransferase involved in cell wall biosynthesis [Polaromonas sp. CG_9.11]
MPGISILVYTKNEQLDILACLQSVAWSDDIHVLDSGSNDATVAIARNFGAHVIERTYGENKLAFGGDEAGHRNWGLKNISFKHEWIYIIDADERMTPELFSAAESAIASPGRHVAFRVQRHDFFLDTWIKHVTPSPFNIRLFLHGKVHYERLVNSITVVDGPVGEIAAHFNHYSFSKGMSNWFDKHNRYSSLEAAQIVFNTNSKAKFSLRKAFFSKAINERRFHQKEMYYRAPFRPLLMFGLLYFVKRGFLDGRAGLTYALLRSIYEYMIVLKVREMKTLEPAVSNESHQTAVSG